MGLPVVIVASGGLPVTEVANAKGAPVEVATNGFGIPVTLVASGGLPITGAYTPYDPAVTMPTPTGATVIATSAADFNTKYQAASSGDMVLVADGTYDGAVALPSGWNKAGVIVRAQNFGSYDSDPMGGSNGPHWARFTRNVTFEFGAELGGTESRISAANVSIIGIKFRRKTSIWPADGAKWSTVITIGGKYQPLLRPYTGGSNILVAYCEFMDGYGTSMTQYDPTAMLADMRSPNPWFWGDSALDSISASDTGNQPAGQEAGLAGNGVASPLAYNRLAWGPVAMFGSATGTLTLYANYIHDMTAGFAATSSTNGAVLIQHNWVERIYQDFMSPATTGTAPTSLKILQNVFRDPFGLATDSGNPHSDTDQIYVTTPSSPPIYWKGVDTSRNLLFAGENTRGNAQFNFFQLSNDHYASSATFVYGVGVKMRENLGFMSGTTHGADLGVTEDAYVRSNLVVHPVGQANTPSTALLTIDGGRASSGAAARSSKGYYVDNIFEASPGADSWGSSANLQQTNNSHIGNRASRSIADATIFSGVFSPYPTSLHGIYEASKRTASYATLGPQSANIRHFLLAPLDWTGERPFAGFADNSSATPSTLTESNPAWLHGGDAGDSLTIAPGAGVEWRTLDLDRTTQLVGWSSSSGTAAADQCYLQIRATSPSAGNNTSFTVTVGGVAFNWSVTSISTVYPRVTFDGSTQSVGQPSSASWASNSDKITLYWEFDLAAAPGGTANVWTAISGTLEFQIQMLTSRKINVLLRQVGGTTALNWNSTTAFATGSVKLRMLLSFDGAQATVGAALKCYVDNGTGSYAQDTGAVTTFNSGVTIDFSRSARRGLNLTLACGFFAFWAKPGVALDVSDSAIQAKFGRSQIGSDGSGPTGAQPEVFLVGYDTLLNATGSTTGTDSNLGSVVMNKNGAASVTTTNGEVWP